MSPVEEALLARWQAGRSAGIPPQDRFRLPSANDNRSGDEFERDLDVIRKCLERKS